MYVEDMFLQQGVHRSSPPSRLISLLKGCFVPPPSGCPTAWDDICCWSRAEVGQVVSLSCANVSELFANTQGK